MGGLQKSKTNINAKIKKNKRRESGRGGKRWSGVKCANLIGLFGAVGGLKSIDETFWHQQQEACHAVQRLAAVNLRLCDDWPRLGRTDGGGGQMRCAIRQITIKESEAEGERQREELRQKERHKCIWPKYNDLS